MKLVWDLIVKFRAQWKCPGQSLVSTCTVRCVRMGYLCRVGLVGRPHPSVIQLSILFRNSKWVFGCKTNELYTFLSIKKTKDFHFQRGGAFLFFKRWRHDPHDLVKVWVTCTDSCVEISSNYCQTQMNIKSFQWDNPTPFQMCFAST